MKIKIKSLIIIPLALIIGVIFGYFYVYGWCIWLSFHPSISEAITTRDPVGWFFFEPFRQYDASPFQVVIWFFGNIIVLAILIVKSWNYIGDKEITI